MLSSRCLALACLFCIVLFVGPLGMQPAYGQASIIPKIQEIEIHRGGRTEFDLQIANRGADPLTFSIQANDLGITEEGLPFISRVEPDRSCVDWISFTPSEFTLESGEVRIVHGVVRASKEAEGRPRWS